MNHSLNLRRPSLPATRLTLPCLLLALACLLAGPLPQLHAQFFQSDDFNDGNDTQPAPGWFRYDPLAMFGLTATYTFPNGGYRLQTPYVTGQQANPGRAGTVRPEVYSDFYVSVDVVSWDDTLPQSFGLLARINTPGLQSTTGYAFTWDRGNPTNPAAGDVDISRITGEAPSRVSVTGSDAIHFEPGKTYRMVFIGRGATLEGRVYELPDTTTPKITVVGSDPTYPSGQNGMVVFDNSGGRAFTDATFDNYYATDIEPPRLKVTAQAFGDYELSWPLEASVYTLQRSTALTGDGWEDVPALEVLNLGDRYAHYFNPETDGPTTRFYRLIRRPVADN
jgi:hypothetical protein